ncbi:hypothetical protein BU25DRAFT_413237 [Macroventuria anomochaeta]|uniref:Uncharacterized protein n=1 Tax=Macroventuria anomochaeta TaxID=301207 RepID=A0ACB6RRU7_9PLEO|nr:uncharacterized protein BU25DRAFT_413237 [Macroventuria anomochaeta]KAF2624690.1 hypothetical protein BU25DRAFT_413237 [Macroventuria anomochaeta]
MSSSRLLARSASSITRTDVCAFCHVRQLLPIGRNSAFRPPTEAAQPSVFRRTYAQKLDVKRLRADVDKKARLGWYKLTKGQKILLLEPDVAEAIYNDFAAHKDRKEYGKLIKQLITKYNVTSEHISGLALMTYSIPDLSDPTKRAMLPPSPHKINAGLILQGCAEIEDPLAIKHIMTAIYLNTYTTAPGARDIALLFPKSEILKYRKSLEALKIDGKDDPEALTLHGLFLEKENQPAKARLLYEKALQMPWVYQYNIQARHPAQLPIIAPWNALGYLLKDSKDPATREKAKWAFEQGAHKGDDPLSYYELSAFNDRSSVEWLKCTSKAAASGHREAMFSLAQFYRVLSATDSPLLQSDTSGKLKSALDWLLGWRQGSSTRLAIEWYEAAGNAGHKAALLQLADWYEVSDGKEKAREVLQRIVEPGEGREEEFPEIVHKAKGRLSGIRTV